MIYLWLGACLAVIIVAIVMKRQNARRESRESAFMPPEKTGADVQEHARQAVALIMKSWKAGGGEEGIKGALYRSGLVHDESRAKYFMGITRLITQSMIAQKSPEDIDAELTAKGVPREVILGAMAALIEYLDEHGAGDEAPDAPAGDGADREVQVAKLVMSNLLGGKNPKEAHRALAESGLVPADEVDTYMGMMMFMLESLKKAEGLGDLVKALTAMGTPERTARAVTIGFQDAMREHRDKEVRGDRSKRPPNSEEAFARLKVLHRVVVYGMTNPPREIVDKVLQGGSEAERRDFDAKFKGFSDEAVADLRKAGAWEAVSPKERAFIESYGSGISDQALTDAVWRKESLAMLLWALSLTREWPAMDQEYSQDDLKKLGQIAAELKGSPQLRPHEEIAAKRNLAELWHWRVRTRELIDRGEVFPQTPETRKAGINSYDDVVRFSARAGLEKGNLPRIIDDDFVFAGKAFRELSEEEFSAARSIIMERHHALNWLCGHAPGNRWDETPTDT